MELRNIQAFIKVAELKSFSRAGEQMGYSQSAVTVQIRQLEKELGQPLLERLGKQVKITQAGERFLPKALAVMDAVREARERFALRGSFLEGSVSERRNRFCLTCFLR